MPAVAALGAATARTPASGGGRRRRGEAEATAAPVPALRLPPELRPAPPRLPPPLRWERPGRAAASGVKPVTANSRCRSSSRAIACDVVRLVGEDEGDADAGAPGAAGAPDAVDVVLAGARGVEVDRRA